ncbi:hypothetical protein [uncultured Nocardioides sp.]|mgnify:CR=1 FL=1|uniref:hypothetical protein n=1 Tax=uncultured Nocardioides sp. TaxID=198441 RepID=UPI0030F66CDE
MSSENPGDSMPKLDLRNLTGMGRITQRDLSMGQELEASRQRMESYRHEMSEAIEAIAEAREEQHAREVASHEALEVTARSMAELLRVHVEGETVAAQRHNQMLHWTRASAIGALAAALLAIVAIIVTVAVA